MEAQQDLENQRQLWQKEKSSLLESLSAMTEALDAKEVERKQSTEGLMDRMKNF